MKKKALILLLVVVAFSPTFGQKPAPLPLPADEMRPVPAATSNRTPNFRGLAQPGAASEAPAAAGTDVKPAIKKEKGPTEIDSLDATFDQKANVAVFIGEVVVKDPEFNVKCDKLTAYLKTAEKAAPATQVPDPKPAKPAKKGGGGLQKAIADANPGNRVVITQNKLQPDGTIQHSVGTGDKATYDAVTGDVILTGKPEIQQGINLVIATSPVTKMTLNRDGHMHAEGPTKTVIVDKGDAGL